MDHQALLRRADRDVDAERVHRERRRGERGDDVDDEERRMRAPRRSRARIAARSQVVPLAVSVWTTKTAPMRVRACRRAAPPRPRPDRSASPRRYGVRSGDAAERLDLLGPAVGEVAGARHQHRRRPARPGWRSPLPSRRGRWRRRRRPRRARSASSAFMPDSQAAIRSGRRASARSVGWRAIALTTSSGTRVGPGECSRRMPGMRAGVFMAKNGSGREE